MVVVDTNILVYLFLEGDRSRDAATLLARDADWRSEPFILVEFANVLATLVRTRALGAKQATTLLVDAERRFASSFHAVTHTDALALANRFAVSAYDARFLAVAAHYGVKLVTEDAKLCSAAPALTQTLAAALAA
jgi:predicted nucleic acid-binding protein